MGIYIAETMMSDYSWLHLYFLNKSLGSLAEAVTSARVFVRGTMRALSREQNRYLSLNADKIHTRALYGSENGC